MGKQVRVPEFLNVAGSLINANEVRRMYFENDDLFVLYANGDRDILPITKTEFDDFCKGVNAAQFFEI